MSLPMDSSKEDIRLAACLACSIHDLFQKPLHRGLVLLGQEAVSTPLSARSLRDNFWGCQELEG